MLQHASLWCDVTLCRRTMSRISVIWTWVRGGTSHWQCDTECTDTAVTSVVRRSTTLR